MKNLTLVLVVLGLTLCSGCRKRSKQDSNPATTDVLAGYHFVGTKQLANNPVAAKLKELWALPESKRLTEQTLQKLAHAPKTLFGEKVGSDQDQRGAALLRPMLDDLLREESFLQVHGAADQTADWTLLVRLPADRLKLWHSNTTELMRTWTLGIPTANAFEGLPVWEVKRSTAPNLVRWARAGQWFALGVGSNSVPALDEALRRINSGAGRPVQNVADAWVEVELNLTRLTKPLDLSAELKWPRTRLSIIGRGENLRTTGRIILSESMTGPITPWQIPTNIIT